VHYNFTTREAMTAAIARGEFLESADVHGNMYGTTFGAISSVAAQGRACILDIDVQGVASCRRAGFEVAAYLFIAPPSVAELEARLRGRVRERRRRLRKDLDELRANGGEGARAAQVRRPVGKVGVVVDARERERVAEGVEGDARLARGLHVAERGDDGEYGRRRRRRRRRVERRRGRVGRGAVAAQARREQLEDALPAEGEEDARVVKAARGGERREEVLRLGPPRVEDQLARKGDVIVRLRGAQAGLELERAGRRVQVVLREERADEREQGQKWFDAVTAQHKQLILAEREACAKLAATTVCDTHIPTGVKIYGTVAAKAIRNRGQA
jgi:hypothetical protein